MCMLYFVIIFYDVGSLKVDDCYMLYFEQCGNFDGKLVVMLYGGLGGGCSEKMCQFYDLVKYCIILFDQCGVGCFMLYVDLVDNIIWDLVVDIEMLCEYFKVDCWQVFGGSWGFILVLVYVQIYLQCVIELVLCGIFMLCCWELEWFYQEGVNCLFLDVWEYYFKLILVVECYDLILVFYCCLISDDEVICLVVVKVWSVWEGVISFLYVDDDFVNSYEDLQFVLVFVCIENYYFVNGGFFEVEE